ncbi:type VI secretion system membrane subunit TssM [Methylotuvimicrobium sp. KM1]|uniref:type VI secretion system membrane subunit TssM n=1 Tax=Methylotuvimicrobium sp. KM1 TaxID=3377707 RepID=UPI00384DCB56
MKKIIGFFKNKWVIQLIGIIAVSLLIWYFGPLIAVAGRAPLESEVSRLITILVIVLLWGLNNLRIQVKANRANTKMVNELVGGEGAQGTTGPSQVEQDSEEEIGELGKHFDDALRTLKQIKTQSGQGRQYLYELPWYIIIGPPGSGKTTALINSGLEFPLADKFGKNAVKGVGGTRNCDWWFTDQAVLLDTAGRYTTQDSHEAVDKAAWLGFLNLLKKHRPRRPVNGVLITMSLSDLIKQTEEERIQHAQAIRQRIQELHEHFGIRFPIYMLFTKCDLVAGFNDFFADLGKEERAQVWGVTFPEEDQDHPIDAVGRVGDDFDGLLDRLNARLPKRLQEERDLQRRHSIFGFPQRMALLKESLLEFLKECYGANRYQQAPYLRGVYFTSGTQEGTPIDRLMGILASTFKLDRFSVPMFSGKGKSFFITRLLKEVIFDEALIVGLNKRVERRYALLRQIAYGSALAVTLLMAALWTFSFTRNQSALNELGEKIQQYEQTAANYPNRSDFADLLKRMNAMQDIQQVYGDEKPLSMRFGLFQGNKVQPVINDTYDQVLLKQFLPLIKTRLEQRIRGEEANNPEILYELLKVYLMFGEPKRLEPGLVRPWVAIDWKKNYADDVQVGLLGHLDNLLELKIEPQPLDQRLVAATRQVLNRIPVAQQVYMRIKSEAMQDGSRDLHLSDALGPNASRVFTVASGKLEQQTIPYLFTHDGFYQVFLKQNQALAKETVEDNWVLGDVGRARAPDPERLQQDVQTYYDKDFIQYWSNMLGNLKIRSVGNIQQSIELLEFASAPNSPIRLLLETIDKETSLTRKPPSPLDALAAVKEDAEKTVDSRTQKLLQAAQAEGVVQAPTDPPGTVVERHFQPLASLVRSVGGAGAPFDQTINLLGQLYGFMIDLGSTSDSGGAAIRIAAQRSEGGGGGDVMSRMKMESARLPEPLKSMTEKLSSGNLNLIMGSSKAQLNKLWQSEVMPLYKSGLEGRYPLSSRASREITLQDFSRFFAPNGILDQFFNANLKPFVDTSGRTWRLITQNNQSIGISRSVLMQFQYAAKIREVFFQGGSQLPSVRFNLRPVSLDAKASRFWLNLEGQQLDYRHGPARSTQLQWPGTDGSGSVRYGFDTLDGRQVSRSEEGAWAWFKLLDKARIQITAQDRFMLTFAIDNLEARYELSATSVDNPFALKELQNFQFPTSL